MKIWILIIAVHTVYGAAMTTVQHFDTKNECMVAGEQSKSLADGFAESHQFVCVEGTK